MFKFPNILSSLSLFNINGKKKENAKPIKREILDMDFFSLLSYMAAISSSGISRTGLFQHASKLPYISARYFNCSATLSMGALAHASSLSPPGAP